MVRTFEFQSSVSGTLKVTDGTVCFSVRYTAEEKVYPGSYWHPEERDMKIISWDIDKVNLFDCLTVDDSLDNGNFDQELASAEARAREEVEVYVQNNLEEIV